MAIEWLTRIWADATIRNHTDAIVLLALGDFANRDGLAWPGIEKLATKARLSVRQTQRVCVGLVKQRKLKIQIGAGPFGTNLYDLTSMGGVSGCHPVRMSPRQDVTGDNGGIQMSPNPSGTVITHSLASGLCNHPAFAVVLAYFNAEMRPTAERFTELECRQAWRDFEMLKDAEGNWYHWYEPNGRRRKLGDWRAGFEDRLIHNRERKDKPNGKHSANHPARPTRNDGTLNAGKASQYRGVGRVVQLPDNGGTAT